MRGPANTRAASVGGGPRRPARAAAALVAVALAAGCGTRPGTAPRPTSVTPDRGGAALPVSVRIRGEGFGAAVAADFDGGGGDVVDARFQARLGGVPLEDVALRQDGTLVATVPAGLAVGTHDLTVVDPSGRAGTLPQAYRVLAANASTVAVARFRVEPVGPQVAFAPFTVAVTALDEAGAVVADFAGEVQLSDLSGAAVPPAVGLFVDGQWTGAVEVRAPHAADVLTVAGPGGASGASAAFAVEPPPPAAVRFDGAPPSPEAGACTGPVTVSLRDAFGFPTVARAPVALAVAASPAAGFTLHAHAGCASPGAPVVAAGEGAVSFWFVATAAGRLELAASGPALAGDVQAASVAAGPPAVLAFLSAPRTATAGACSAPLTVEVRDAWGNPTPAGVAALALAATPAGGLSFSADACGTPAAAVAIPAGASTASLWFRGDVAGAFGVTVSGPGLAAAAQDAVVVAADADSLAFATPARATAAGACSAALVVEARDRFGNPAPGARPVRVALSASPAAGLALFADAACSTLAPDVAIQAGASSASFHYRGTAAGDVAVTARAPVLGAATQVERVGPAAPASLAFVSAPQTVQAGACSSAAALGLLDAFGNAAPAPASVAVALGASPPGLTFHADAACLVPATAVTVPAGSSTAAFYFRATAAGAVDVTASASGLAPASQAEVIVPAAASALRFTTAPQTVTAGACSGAVTVEARDAHGNPVALSAAAPTPIGLAAPGLTLHADAACAGGGVTSVPLPAAATAVTFHFRGTAAGPAAITASAAGVAAASQTQSIVPAAASQLAFATAPQTAVAGACSAAVTVEARDVHGNPAPPSAAAPVIVDLAASGLALYTDAACAGAAVPSVTIAAGATGASFWFHGTLAGPAAVTASAAGLPPATQLETIVAAAASQLAFATGPQTVTAGACSGEVTVQSRDVYGNPATISGTAATAVALAAPGLTLSSDPACAGAATGASIPAAGTSASFHFRGTIAGAAGVTASATGLAPATQTETIVAAAAAALVFTTAPQAVAAGACSGVVTFQSRDAHGNPAPLSAAAPTTVVLAAPGLTLYPDAAACAGVGGTAVTLPAAATAASFHFRGTAAGTATLTASAAGVAPASQLETITPSAATQLAFASPERVVTAGSCAGPVTLESRDAWDNAAPVSPVLPTPISLATGALTLHEDAACLTPAEPLSLAAAATTATFYVRGTAAGPAPVTASATGLAPATQVETIVAAAGTRLVFATAPVTLQAGACSAAIVLEARDPWGNPGAVSAAASTVLALAAPGLTLHADPGCAASVSSITLAAGERTAELHVAGTRAGIATVTASAPGLDGASQDETVVAAPASRLAFLTGTQRVTAGSCSEAVTLESRDAWDNPSAASSVAVTDVTLSGAGLSFHVTSGCAGGVSQVSLAPGATTATFRFRGTTAGTVGVTAAAAGLSSTTQPQTIVAGAADHLVWSAIPSPQLEGVAFAVTVAAVDAHGNPAEHAGTATLAASPGTVACLTGCTTAAETAAFAGGGWSGTVSVPSAATGVTLTATGSGLTGASAAFDVVGPASRSPPLARFTTAARVITSGNTVTFDASASSDYQTPASSLAVSWHFEARDADQASAALPPAAPWTAWSTLKTASHAFVNNTGAPIVYRPRLAVRDTEAGPGGPDVGYATGVVIVLPSASDVCVVDTDSLVDDSAGSTSCDVRGPDGRLSLTEALRVANASAATLNVIFAGPRSLVAAGGVTLTVARPVRIVADPGAVVLDGVSLAITGTNVLVSGLELRHLATPITVSPGADALLEDVDIHDGQGLEVLGRARVLRARMWACSGIACVREAGANAYLAVFSSDLRGTGSDVGISLDACAGASPYATGSSPYLAFANGWSDSGAAFVGATVLGGFGTALALGPGAACANPWITNVTFDGNVTGIRAEAGAAGYLTDSIFTRHSGSAMVAATCALALNARHLVWQNAANGCVGAGTLVVEADPLYVYPARRDYRLQYASPARDAANGGNNVEVDDAGPGLYLGAAPDRGGRETY